MTMSTGTSMQDVLNAYTQSASNTYTQKASASVTASTVNTTKTSDSGETGKTSASVSSSSEYGNIIGNPELSDTAKAYYEQLKEKYGDYNFVLVSDDQSATAMQQAASFASGDKTTVLIDVSRVEAMASDDSVREKFETILDNADQELDSLKSGLQSSGADVEGYGIQVNDDGSLSFFAVLKQSTEAQKERIEDAKEAAKEEEAEEEKKTKQEESREKLEELRNQNEEQRETVTKSSDPDAVKIFTASSIDELLQQISEYSQNERMNSVQTEEELAVGQHIDFRG